MLFYYLLRPIVIRLEEWHIPRYISIIFIYLIIGILLALFVTYLSPVLADQITALANTSADTLKKARTQSNFFLFDMFRINWGDEFLKILFGFFQEFTTALSKNFIDFLSYIARVATILAVIPFIVFYLLKDDRDFFSEFLRYIPQDYHHEAKRVLRNIDETFSNYIRGVLLVSSTLGVLLFIGYLIIGLDYPVLLAIIAFIFTTIPFLGPFLAIAPAIFVGFGGGLLMVLKVIIVFVIIQQCESNIISPQLIGHRLHIHPLTIILLLLVAGSLWGVVGLIFVTPLYAVLKVLIEGLYKMIKTYRANKTKLI